MTTTVGIRDLVRNSRLLEEYDYVDVEDKRSHTYKGLFVSPKYAEELKAYLKKKIRAEKRKAIAEVMQFAGMENGVFGEKNVQELTAEKRKRYEDR
jgi:hypothetical protein